MILKFKSLTMRNQTLLIQGTMFSLVLIIFTIVLIPLTQLELDIIRQSSHEALLKSNDARVSQLSKNMNTLINRAFEQVSITLNKVQQLNNVQLNSSNQIRDCWPKKNNSGIILSYCYNEQVDQTSNYSQNYGNLLNQMDQFLFSFILDNLSQFQIIFRINKPHYTSFFALANTQQNFNLETRPYYYETLQQNSTRYIVDPYINQAQFKLTIMITQKMYDQEHKPEKIMGIGMQLDMFDRYLSFKNVKFVICTLQGIIIVTNLDNIDAVQYKTFLQNQTYFPFNQEDWSQLNIYLQNKTYQSNCKSSFIKFCRNLNGSDIQIEANIIRRKFIYIIFNDLSFTKQENAELQRNMTLLLRNVADMFLIFFPCSFALLLISSITLAYHTKPTSEMINMINVQVKSSFENTYGYIQQQKKKDNIFRQLQNSFQSLIQRHVKQRTKTIRIYNQYRFPLVDKKAQLDSSGIQLLDNKIKRIEFIKQILINDQ